MKETYKVKVPKHIKVGDPWYFEKYAGEKIKRLTVDEDIPSHLTEARVKKGKGGGMKSIAPNNRARQNSTEVKPNEPS